MAIFDINKNLGGSVNSVSAPNLNEVFKLFNSAYQYASGQEQLKQATNQAQLDSLLQGMDVQRQQNQLTLDKFIYEKEKDELDRVIAEKTMDKQLEIFQRQQQALAKNGNNNTDLNSLVINAVNNALRPLNLNPGGKGGDNGKGGGGNPTPDPKGSKKTTLEDFLNGTNPDGSGNPPEPTDQTKKDPKNVLNPKNPNEINPYFMTWIKGNNYDSKNFIAIRDEAVKQGIQEGPANLLALSVLQSGDTFLDSGKPIIKNNPDDDLWGYEYTARDKNTVNNLDPRTYKLNPEKMNNQIIDYHIANNRFKDLGMDNPQQGMQMINISNRLYQHQDKIDLDAPVMDNLKKIQGITGEHTVLTDSIMKANAKYNKIGNMSTREFLNYTSFVQDDRVSGIQALKGGSLNVTKASVMARKQKNESFHQALGTLKNGDATEQDRAYANEIVKGSMKGLQEGTEALQKFMPKENVSQHLTPRIATVLQLVDGGGESVSKMLNSKNTQYIHLKKVWENVVGTLNMHEADIGRMNITDIQRKLLKGLDETNKQDKDVMNLVTETSHVILSLSQNGMFNSKNANNFMKVPGVGSDMPVLNPQSFNKVLDTTFENAYKQSKEEEINVTFDSKPLRKK